jgi:hypothetical protein
MNRREEKVELGVDTDRNVGACVKRKYGSGGTTSPASRQGYSAKESEFDLIYVNGGNNLENLKASDDTWKVRLIEEDFHRLMFEMEGV